MVVRSLGMVWRRRRWRGDRSAKREKVLSRARKSTPSQFCRYDEQAPSSARAWFSHSINFYACVLNMLRGCEKKKQQQQHIYLTTRYVRVNDEQWSMCIGCLLPSMPAYALAKEIHREKVNESLTLFKRHIKCEGERERERDTTGMRMIGSCITVTKKNS